MKPFLTLLFLTTAAFQSIHAQQSGTLDHTFDQDGKVTTSIGMANSFAKAVSIQPDGKIIAAGIASTGGQNNFAVTRYLGNGSPDISFNGTGMLMTDFNQGDAFAFAIATRSADSKIAVGGYINNGNGLDFAVARYNTDGSLDNSFAGGKIITSFGGISFGQALAFQQDGKLIMAGYSNQLSFNQFSLIRYLDDGSPDPTFDVDGKVTTQVGSSNSAAFCMAIQNDNKILLAGQAFNDLTQRWEFSLTRYNTDGSLDIGFDGDGIVITPSNNTDDLIHSIALQPDGKIVAAGYSGTSTANNNFMLARYNQDGSLDSTFGINGKLISPFDVLNNQATSVLVQPDGKIIAGGFVLVGNTDQFAIARFDTNGNPDMTFGNTGKTNTIFGGNDGIDAMALQGDGKIVAVGTSFNGNGFSFALGRYHAFLSTGISDEPVSEMSLEAYPNPVSEHLNVCFTLSEAQTVSIQLLDVQGRILQTVVADTLKQAGKQLQRISIPSNLPSGIYYVRLTTSSGISTVKIVK